MLAYPPLIASIRRQIAELLGTRILTGADHDIGPGAQVGRAVAS